MMTIILIHTANQPGWTNEPTIVNLQFQWGYSKKKKSRKIPRKPWEQGRDPATNSTQVLFVMFVVRFSMMVYINSGLEITHSILKPI